MYIIYGRENCTFCTQAKDLLTAKKKDFEYKKLGDDYEKDVLLELCSNFGVVARTVPQIFKVEATELKYVGGFEELRLLSADQL